MDFNFFRNIQPQPQQPNNQNMDFLSQLQELMFLLQTKSPKEAFHELCKKRGLNPDDVLNQFR